MLIMQGAEQSGNSQALYNAKAIAHTTSLAATKKENKDFARATSLGEENNLALAIAISDSITFGFLSYFALTDEQETIMLYKAKQQSLKEQEKGANEAKEGFPLTLSIFPTLDLEDYI
jgi:hypothetical protein